MCEPDERPFCSGIGSRAEVSLTRPGSASPGAPFETGSVRNAAQTAPRAHQTPWTTGQGRATPLKEAGCGFQARTQADVEHFQAH
jgi:hypothetical protein